MRILAPVFIWLALAACCQAQATLGLDAYPHSEAAQRWDSKAKIAMAALQAGNQDKKSRKAKKDPALESSFTSQTFQSGNDPLAKKSSGVSPFLYDQKTLAKSYPDERSFFGIKNPWFGNKAYQTDKADLWSKTLIANSDKKFRTEQAGTKAFAAEGKAAAVKAPVETKGYVVQGAAQGSVSKITDKIHKDMTVEEVRELLNKNR